MEWIGHARCRQIPLAVNNLFIAQQRRIEHRIHAERSLLCCCRREEISVISSNRFNVRRMEFVRGAVGGPHLFIGDPVLDVCNCISVPRCDALARV